MSDGAKHFDEGKAGVEDLPWEALEGAARAFDYGKGKYGRFNWLAGMAWTRLAGSALRHLLKWMAGEELDTESGLSHLDHALANLMMLRTYTKRGLGTDDRYKP